MRVRGLPAHSKEPGLEGWGWRCDHGWFPIPGNHKFIFWISHVFCDLLFLTLWLGTCFKETVFFLHFFCLWRALLLENSARVWLKDSGCHVGRQDPTAFFLSSFLVQCLLSPFMDLPDLGAVLVFNSQPCCCDQRLVLTSLEVGIVSTHRQTLQTFQDYLWRALCHL